MKIVKITKEFCSRSYRSFDPSKLKVGDVVESDIFIKKSGEFVIIIEANTKLSEKLYKLLSSHQTLYVVDEGKENEGLQCDRLLRQIQVSDYSLNESLEKIYTLNKELFSNFIQNKNNKIDISCVESIVESIIFVMQKNEDFLKNIKPILHNSYDLDVHSLNVTIYSLYIGQIIGISHKQMLQLGTASMLHDVGKKLIMDIVNKDSRLDAYEEQSVKKHSNYSVDLVKENNIEDQEVLDAILQHHERYDGSGYPSGLGKRAINNFASIIAVADVFDAMTIDRPHRKGYSSFESLKILMRESMPEGKFNGEYVKMLLV